MMDHQRFTAMRRRFAFFLWFILLLPLAAVRAGEAQWNVHLQFTAVTLPLAASLPIVDDFEDPAHAPAAWEKLLASVKAGEAEIAGQLLGQALSGTELKSATQDEFPAPSRFEDPIFPNADSRKEVESVPQHLASIAMRPSEFQPVKTGLSMQALPEVTPDGRFINLKITVNHDRFTRWHQVEVGVTPGGTKLTFSQPGFFKINSTMQFVLASGTRHLIGTHQLEGKPERVELFFVKAWAARVERVEGAEGTAKPEPK